MIQVGKKVAKIDSAVLAGYILKTCGKMSHLKLQKLLFYVQAYHLAYFDSPLIDDEFEAWLHGPVSRKIFDTLKGEAILYAEVGFEDEYDPIDILKNSLTEDQLNVIDEVLSEYGPLSGPVLESITHSEDPWIEARKGCAYGDKCTAVISNSSIAEFYKKQIYGSEGNKGTS